MLWFGGDVFIMCAQQAYVVEYMKSAVTCPVAACVQVCLFPRMVLAGSEEFPTLPVFEGWAR